MQLISRMHIYYGLYRSLTHCCASGGGEVGFGCGACRREKFCMRNYLLPKQALFADSNLMIKQALFTDCCNATG